MMLRFLKIGVFCGVALLSLTGCPPDKAQVTLPPRTADEIEKASEVVAVVNGEELTYAELERRINGLHPYARSRYTTAESRKEFLDRQIEFELLAQYAASKGYNSSPEVRHIMKETMVRQLLERELNARVGPRDISQEKVRQRYEADIQKYRQAETRRAGVIVVEQQTTAEQLRAELGEQPVARETFMKLASANNLDAAVAKNGGVIGFVEDPSAPHAKNTGKNKAISERVFELEQPGMISEPFELDGAWYLATYFDRRPARDQSLSNVSPQIREALIQERRAEARQEFIQELTKQAKVTTNEDVLSKLEAPKPEESRRNPLQDFEPPTMRDIRGARGSAPDERAGETGSK